jgi:hypothetical protein
MIVTDLANLVRNVASSIAESPPPTTAMSWSRKKKPSHVAHADTPRPSNVCSPGTFRYRAAAPMASTTERAPYRLPLTVTYLTGPSNSTDSTSSDLSSAPNLTAWLRICSIRSGPMMPSEKPGKFSTSVVVIRAPPNWLPSNTNGSS